MEFASKNSFGFYINKTSLLYFQPILDRNYLQLIKHLHILFQILFFLDKQFQLFPDKCNLAQAHDFVSSFPEGYDTHIEQGGTNVSGGQKQRLCIARALLKKPKILILDDSTSAVDTRTDAFIRAGFKSYIPATTKIIIAQRVASVLDADLILMMEGGRIAAAGNHEQLLASCAMYREIYEQQTRGGDDHE